MLIVKFLQLDQKTYLVEQAFNIKLNDSQATLKGVISRKKQVVPAITAVMSD